MLTGSMVLKRAMAVVALALSSNIVFGAPVGAAPVDTGQTCVAENWVWTGSATLDATVLVLNTMVTIPVVAGTQLFVSGVSADGLSADGHARALRVTIGGVAAVPGQLVPGGPIMVVGDGATADVRSAIVSIDRCSQVQVAAPVAGGGSPRLPHTGIGLNGSIIGAMAVAVGVAMMVLGRRRTAA